MKNDVDWRNFDKKSPARRMLPLVIGIAILGLVSSSGLIYLALKHFGVIE